MARSDVLELLAALVDLRGEELHLVLRLRQLRNACPQGHVVVSWDGQELSWESRPEVVMLLDKKLPVVV